MTILAKIKSFDWVAFVVIVSLVGSIFGLTIGLTLETNKNLENAKQCETSCFPYAVINNEDKYCLCANNTTTVIWRKDIKSK
jgi:hypothetical protein